nr:hypothetical protein [Cronobacter sakazakii]
MVARRALTFHGGPAGAAAPATSSMETPASLSWRATGTESPAPTSFTTTGTDSAFTTRLMAANTPRQSRSPPVWSASCNGLR